MRSLLDLADSRIGHLGRSPGDWMPFAVAPRRALAGHPWAGRPRKPRQGGESSTLARTEDRYPNLSVVRMLDIERSLRDREGTDGSNL